MDVGRQRGVCIGVAVLLFPPIMIRSLRAAETAGQKKNSKYKSHCPPPPGIAECSDAIRI